MSAYYNEFKPEAAHMLRQLIKDGLIAPGDVDDRSITEVKAYDVKGFTQCHFFAGIGGWSVALRQAGWSDTRPVWTGSCPCQPFSTAGKKKGKADERDLWPVWFNLIRQCGPSSVYGEQVSSAISHGWLDRIYADMEAEGYAIGAAVLPACSVDAPHKRDRLWFVAKSHSEQLRVQQGKDRGEEKSVQGEMGEQWLRPDIGDGNGNMGNPKHNGRDGCSLTGSHETPILGCEEGQNGSCQSEGTSNTGSISTGSMADTELFRCERQPLEQCAGIQQKVDGAGEAREPVSALRSGSWNDYEWILCGDNKIRRIPSAKSGICELVDGIPNDPLQKHYEGVPIVTAQKVQGRAALLHALGNAIVPEVAARFIRATM